MRYDILFLSVFHTWSMVVSAQNAIEISRVISQSKEAYRAGTQDRAGRMYFANNEGLLTIDGYFWKLHPIPSPNQHSQVSDGGLPEHRNE
jgi:hypothetical protein